MALEAQPRLALIEDHADLREELQVFLAAQGFSVWAAADAESFWRMLHARPVDIVLIDIGLPGEDGFSVASYLRELGRYGLIILTARGGLDDKLHGLALGADHFLVKPVNFLELAGQIQALWSRLRRDVTGGSAEGRGPVDGAASGNPVTAWRLDAAGPCLFTPQGKSLPLTPQENTLLAALLQRPGEVIAKQELHEVLFGNTEDTDLHRVDVVLSRLRRKAMAETVRLPIRTLFGRGLVFQGGES